MGHHEPVYRVDIRQIPRSSHEKAVQFSVGEGGSVRDDVLHSADGVGVSRHAVDEVVLDHAVVPGDIHPAGVFFEILRLKGAQPGEEIREGAQAVLGFLTGDVAHVREPAERRYVREISALPMSTGRKFSWVIISAAFRMSLGIFSEEAKSLTVPEGI